MIGRVSDNLARRQAGVAVLVALVLGVLFSAAQLTLDYVRERQRIENVARGIMALMADPATRAAFTLDRALAETVMGALAAIPSVLDADLRDDLGRTLASLRRPPPDLPLRWLTDRIFGGHRRYEQPLVHGPDGTAPPIGRLALRLDTRVLAHDFLARSGTALGFGLARSLLLGLALAFLFHLLVTRPLTSLVRALERVEPAMPDARPLTTGPTHARDELGRLAGTINDLLRRFAGTLAAERRAEAERRRLEAELRQAEKMKALGTLAGGVAHDFSNILATIRTAVELAQAGLPNDGSAVRALDRALAASERGRALVAQIMQFSRLERRPAMPIELGDAVAEAVELCRATLPPEIELRCRRPDRPLRVLVEDSQVHRLVSNLCANAADAMPDGGHVTVEVTAAEQAGRTMARLSVIDHGSGIDAAVLPRLFEPFFTTKPVGKGTGLGLAVVHGLVTGLGGTIEVASEPGRGATFRLWLPLAEPDC